jgi:hypothetical protein
MRSDRLRTIASAALATAILILGCASGPRERYRHEYTLSPGQEHHAGLASALLVPINYLNDDPVRDLAVADQSVANLIAARLESKGIEVERVDPHRFHTVASGVHRALNAERKSGEADAASDGVGFGDAIPEILAQLEESPDLVIVPNIVIRTGEWIGTRTLVWDGVRRRDSTGGNIDWSGTGTAASVQVIVYSKDGTHLFSGFGGLDLVFQLNMSKEIMEIREPLLRDERNLREGVCVAFYPWFGLEEICRR